jgi:predicted GNAT family N-acyltransferase
VLATAPDGTPIGTGRLKLDCHIGRMAVVRHWRGRGVGASILNTLISFAEKEGCEIVRLHAQTHALEFYARFGFTAVGDVFEEAGIPHRLMELSFPQPPSGRQ